MLNIILLNQGRKRGDFMGFSAGLYRYPKYKTKLDSRDYNYIETFLNYKNNSWAQEKFSSAEEYASAYLSFKDKKEYNKPTSELIDFFKDKITIDIYGDKHLYQEMGVWYSNGSGDIYDWFNSLSKEKNEIQIPDYNLQVELTQKDIYVFLKFCWEGIKQELPQPGVINNSFKYLGEEREEILLSKCDGIEVVFENGDIKRFDTNPDFGCEFLISQNYCDETALDGYILGIEYGIEILKTTNFETQTIIYTGGW